MSSNSLRRPLKAKKDIDEDIISNKFIFVITEWNSRKDRCGLDITAECSLCEIDWLVTFKGSDFHTDFASIHITNLSERSVTASYSFTIKNELESRDITFTDPEESVMFDPDGGGDDTWGTDEFVLSSSIANDASSFIQDGSLVIEVKVQICGIVKSSATLLSQAIENSTGSCCSILLNFDFLAGI